MKEIILLKNGELALKGLNRHTFENQLIKNMKFRLHDLGKIRYVSSQSTITVEPIDENVDLDEAFRRIRMIFGIAGISRCAAVEKDMDVISTALRISTSVFTTKEEIDMLIGGISSARQTMRRMK